MAPPPVGNHNTIKCIVYDSIRYIQTNIHSFFVFISYGRCHGRYCIHTYIIGHYNSSVRIIDLVSHTTYVVCVNFYTQVAGPTSLESTPNDRFFEKLFMAVLFTLRIFARNLLRGNRRRNICFSYFVLMLNLRDESGLDV